MENLLLSPSLLLSSAKRRLPICFVVFYIGELGDEWQLTKFCTIEFVDPVDIRDLLANEMFLILVCDERKLLAHTVRDCEPYAIAFVSPL